MIDTSRLLKDYFVYWLPGTNDGRGKFIYTQGVLIKGRVTTKSAKSVLEGFKSYTYTELLTDVELLPRGRVCLSIDAAVIAVEGTEPLRDMAGNIILNAEGNPIYIETEYVKDPYTTGVKSFNIASVDANKSIDAKQILYKAVLEYG